MPNRQSGGQSFSLGSRANRTSSLAGWHFDGVRLTRAWCFSIRHSMIAYNAGDGISLRGWDGFFLDNWLSGNLGAGFAAREENIVAGPDGALWFSEYLGNRIGRIKTSGAITEYPIPTSNGGPFWIAAGPDGALWFTEFNVNKIGRITTTGIITEYVV